MKIHFLFPLLLIVFLACKKDDTEDVKEIEPEPEQYFDFSGAKALVKVKEGGSEFYKKLTANDELVSVALEDRQIERVRVSSQNCLLIWDTERDLWYIDQTGEEYLLDYLFYSKSYFKENGDLLYEHDHKIYTLTHPTAEPLQLLTSFRKNLEIEQVSGNAFQFEIENSTNTQYIYYDGVTIPVQRCNSGLASAVGNVGVMINDCSDDNFAYISGDSAIKVSIPEVSPLYSLRHDKGSLFNRGSSKFGYEFYFLGTDQSLLFLGTIHESTVFNDEKPMIFDDKIIVWGSSNIYIVDIKGSIDVLVSDIIVNSIGLVGKRLFYSGMVGGSFVSKVMDITSGMESNSTVSELAFDMYEYSAPF